jgi:hypothetical protein
LNDALERLSERQYVRDNHELFEGWFFCAFQPNGEIEVISQSQKEHGSEAA